MLALLPFAVAALPAWTVTFETSTGVDHGNGKIAQTIETKLVVTPTQVTRSKATKPRALDAEVGKAIAGLLPRLPTAGATFSISDFVNDEGWYDETLTVERDGKALVFHLRQGKQAPPLPPELVELKRLLSVASGARK
ncbi:MAG: hypothetical protein JNJ54_29390 [Myxococcaceae bacterium]|nr:hypothetical protein [Myxococcaceae bacterium]